MVEVFTYIGRKSVLRAVLTTVLLVSVATLPILSVCATDSHSIELEHFYWNEFPLRVLVDMNQWSSPDYAIAVREALDGWVKSTWNYTRSFTDMTLAINYLFFMSNVNSTNNYDVLITFTANEIPPTPNTVGLTILKWNSVTHEPIPPTTIQLTTYSKTADYLFIRNVAMHEFGHALGVGHASSPDTSDGPELMYPTTSNDQIVYPSTLDVYALTRLYQGTFGQRVQLPPTIPYKMLVGDSVPPPIRVSPLHVLYPQISELQYVLNNPQEMLYQPTILLVPLILWMVIALAFGLTLHSRNGGTLVTIIISIIIAYYIEIRDPSLVSLSLKIVPLIPVIAIGASVGEVIDRKFSKTNEETIGELSIAQWEGENDLTDPTIC